MNVEKFRRRLESELAIVQGVLPAALTRKSRKSGKNSYTPQHLEDARKVEHEIDYVYSDEEDKVFQPQAKTGGFPSSLNRTSDYTQLCPCGQSFFVQQCECDLAKAVGILRHFLHHREEPPWSKRRLSEDEFMAASNRIYRVRDPVKTTTSG